MCLDLIVFLVFHKRWNNALPIDLNDFNLAKAQLEEVNENSLLAHKNHTSTIKNLICTKKTVEGENAANKTSKLKQQVDFEDECTMSLLKTMTTQIIYGGHVSDSWDQNCMAKLYDRCFATSKCINRRSSLNVEPRISLSLDIPWVVVLNSGT